MSLKQSILTPRAVNWRTRHAVGLESLWMPGYGCAASPDLVGRRKLTTATGGYGVGPFGQHWGRAQTIYSGTDFLADTYEYSLLLVWFHDVNGTFKDLLITSGTTSLRLRVYNAVDRLLFGQYNSTLGNQDVAINGGVNLNENHAVLFTHTRRFPGDPYYINGAIRGFHNGSLSVENNFGPDTQIDPSSLYCGVGSNSPKMYMLAWWNRELTIEEGIDLTRDPSILLAEPIDDYAALIEALVINGPYRSDATELFAPGASSRHAEPIGAMSRSLMRPGSVRQGASL